MKVRFRVGNLFCLIRNQYPIVFKERGDWKPDESECGFRTGFENIVGGRRASLGEFPFMALLGYNVSGKDEYR